jgi:PadR family transcriptional regulator PadR
MAVTNTSEPCSDLSAFQRDLVTVLAHTGPCKGLTVMAAVEPRHPAVTAGRLYPNLDQLVEAGLVEKVPVDGRTNRYALTSVGERELIGYQQWLSDGTDDCDGRH